MVIEEERVRRTYMTPAVNPIVMSFATVLCGSLDPINPLAETEDYVEGSFYGDSIFD